MGLKDTVENHPVVWVLGMVVAAFLAGIGTYDGILRISGSQVVSRDAHVLADDEKALSRTDYEKLLMANTELIAVSSENEALKKRLTTLESHHEFVVRYLRYVTSREILDADFSQENKVQFELAEKMFVDLIENWWNQQHQLDGSLVLNQQIIRKGLDPTNSRVEFADGTVWPIPTEIKRKVLQEE
ncbi:MAG: hypothetical protein AB7G75_08040 [Candidatus Binatia bacterium]